MKKESSKIKDIFNNITKEKNEEAIKDIKRKRLRFHKITEPELLQLAYLFDLDYEKTKED